MKNLAAAFSNNLSRTFRTSVLAMTDYSSSGGSRLNSVSGSGNNSGFQFKKIKRFAKNSKMPFIVVGFIVLVLLIIVIHNATRHTAMGQTPTVATTPTGQVSIAKPLVSETLNKNFQFPLNNAAGQQVSQIQYTIQSAELDNQIVVQGQVATAVQGRVFLILNLAVTNNYDKSVQLNTRDYVRLVINNSAQKLAADIHNDPVDVEPISTKYTRLGFPIDSNYKSLTLQVGQITGPKQTIQLNFK